MPATPSAPALLALLLIGGCAAGPNAGRAPRRAVPPVEVGELPAAAPVKGPPSDRGQTGRAMRVVLGARRERVAELFRSYLRALGTRDPEALARLFDEVVVDLDGTAVTARADVLSAHERLMAQGDLSALLTVADTVTVSVRSTANFRANVATERPPAAMRPGDWIIDTPAGLGHGVLMGLSLPRRFLVRWNGSEPVIVGLARMRAPR